MCSTIGILGCLDIGMRIPSSQDDRSSRRQIARDIYWCRLSSKGGVSGGIVSLVGYRMGYDSAHTSVGSGYGREASKA